MGPRHTRGHAEVSEPLGTQRWWHFDSKFVFPMYKHTPMPPLCYETIHMRVYSREASRILQKGGTFFYVVHTQHLVAKPRIAS